MDLRSYLQENFDFSNLKKAGFFPKQMKFNDYEGQAKRICQYLSLTSIYDYSNIGRGTSYHASYARPTPFTRFVETIGESLMKVEGKTAKVIPLNLNNA